MTTEPYKSNFFQGPQLWKLDGKVLYNHGGLWMSDEEWNFKAKDNLIYIENISRSKVLGTTNDGEVTLEDFKENKAEQLWKKGGVRSKDGFYSLENSKVPKVLTAISSSNLEIKGKMNKSDMTA